MRYFLYDEVTHTVLAPTILVGSKGPDNSVSIISDHYVFTVTHDF